MLLLAAPYARAQAVDESSLLRQLQQGNAEAQIDAMQQLGAYKDTAVVSALLAALRDDNPLLRAQAAASLGACGNARALQPLLAACKDDFIIVSTQAVVALGQLHAPEAQPTLLALLQATHSTLRVPAATALGYCGGADARVGAALLAAYHEGDLPLRQAALGALATREDPQFPAALRTALRDASPSLRHTALQLLPHLPAKDALPLYRAALRDSELENRRLAVSQLTVMSSTYALELLLQALHDPAIAVRRTAIPALGLSRDARIVAPLVACISPVADGDAESAALNTDIADALRHVHSSMPVEQIVARLHGAEKGLRAALIATLVLQRNGAAAAPLLAAQHDPEAAIRAMALDGLALIATPAMVPGLLVALKDEDVRVRSRAVKWIDTFASSRLEVDDLRPALASLHDCLKDPDPTLRSSAVSALGALHDPDATSTLLAMLDDPDAMVRNTVFVVLENLGDLRAVPALLARIDERGSGYQIAAIGRPALPAVLDALQQTKDPTTRHAAAKVLQAMRDPRAIDPLLDALRQEQDPDLRLQACLALRLYRVPRVRALMAQYLHGDDPRLRKAIAETLTYSDSEHATDLLLPLLHDPDHDVVMTAIRGLADAADPHALQALLPLLHDQRDDIHQRVANDIFLQHGQDCFDLLLSTLAGKDAGLRLAALQGLAFQFDRCTLHRADIPRVFPAVTPLLHDADAETREATVHALDASDDARAVPQLITVLVHDDAPNVRASAADALDHQGDDRAVAPLIAALHDPENGVRHAAAQALGHLSDQRAIPTRKALHLAVQEEHLDRNGDDINSQERADTADALEQLSAPVNPESVLNKLDNDMLLYELNKLDKSMVFRDWQHADALRHTLAQPAVIAVALFSLALEDNTHLLQGAVIALGLLKERRAVPQLLDCYWRLSQPPAQDTRYLVLAALANIADPRATPLLLAVLRSTQLQDQQGSSVRAEIARALGTFDDPRVLAPLQEAMAHDVSAQVRLSAAAALARRGDSEAMTMLLQSAQGAADSPYTYFVPQALAYSGRIEAVEPLRKLLASDDTTLREQAATVLPLLLNSSTDPRVAGLVAPLLLAEVNRANSMDERLVFLAPLADRHDARAIAPLSALLAEYPARQTVRVVALLREIGGTGVLAPLREALHAPSISVREAAAEALGALGDHAAVPALRALVQTDTTRVRVKAIEALGHLKDRPSVALLRVVLSEKGTRVRAAARQALREMGVGTVLPSVY